MKKALKYRLAVRLERSYLNPGALLGHINRKLYGAMIGNFHVLFCEYHYRRRVVQSTAGDISDPFRREKEWLEHLYITI